MNIPKHLVVKRNIEKFIPINLQYFHFNGMFIGRFIGANFSKLAPNNQIYGNAFVSNHYRLSKISARIIDCKFLIPLMLFDT